MTTVGILYESSEWSDFKLAEELAACGLDVRMIDFGIEGALADDAFGADPAIEAACRCDALVSRVFASAVVRGHACAHRRMAALAERAQARGITMINPPRAHFFEIDKRQATAALAQAGIDVPRIRACGTPDEITAAAAGGTIAFPCIVKPNCGGRTTLTAIVRDEGELSASLDAAPPDIALLAEDYLTPEFGFITRVELVDGAIALIVKRSVVAGGLSAYHLGSTYEVYRDAPRAVREAALAAGRTLSIRFGSFDIIECGGRAYVIDANSVSNVSQDNTEMFGIDLMQEYARAIARICAGKTTADAAGAKSSA